VYDIRNELAPVKVGTIGNDCVVAACEAELPGVHVSTAHVFRINPDGYTMAIGWYNDGVHVMDFSDIRGPSQWGTGTSSGVGTRTIGRMKMPNANTWAAKMWQERHPGYVFASDMNRGLDIFFVPELAGGFFAMGTVHVGHQFNFTPNGGIGATRADFESNCEYSPRTNGVDGWVTAIPADLADGTQEIKVDARTNTTGAWDVDLYYYDASCGLIEADEDESTYETGTIPQGAKYVMAAVWSGAADAQLKLRFETI
jgi:hypothetical protein